MYYIRYKNNETDEIKDAKPFIYEGINFFTWYDDKENKFQVVETTTGLLISISTTEEDAINEMKYILKEKGIEFINQQLALSREKLGIKTIRSISPTEKI